MHDAMYTTLRSLITEAMTLAALEAVILPFDLNDPDVAALEEMRYFRRALLLQDQTPRGAGDSKQRRSFP